jgi:hypothetical protein
MPGRESGGDRRPLGLGLAPEIATLAAGRTAACFVNGCFARCFLAGAAGFVVVVCLAAGRCFDFTCDFTGAFAFASGFGELRPEAGRARSGCRLLRDPLEAACALGTGCLPEPVAAPAPSARPDVFFFDAAIPQGVRKSAPTLIAHARLCQPRYQPKWLEIKGFATYHRRASFLILSLPLRFPPSARP